MARLPKGWKKITENESVIAYSKGNYIVYVWKSSEGKNKIYSVEPFRKLANYKRRLFKRDFKKLSEANAFAWELMKQKEIRSYYGDSKNIVDED